ncbi:hypothetical protein BC941DRAFT_422587 [Chlamydoabsidia padenii]|nr:hypothetical protein BC941DRAFT_422587 [Chlamydoabsidia padenii]
MTTFGSSQRSHQLYQQTTNGTNYEGVNKRQHQQHLRDLTSSLDSPSLSPAPVHSTHYTTSQQNTADSETATDSTSLNTSPSMVPNNSSSVESDEDDDDYEDDEDDVEIIMHDTNDSFNYPSSGLDNHSAPVNHSPVAAAPYDSSQKHSWAPLYHSLQRQLEYYFSRQNLTKDTYLVSQMDPDLYVPIATIAKFKRVLDITSDMDIIVSTLRRSTMVTVNQDGTKVKPNISIQRTTIILREMPDATEMEIKQFLQDLKSPPIKNIKNEYANMWYITFESEQDALKMMYEARGTTFKGHYVATRMKSEPVVGSIQARQSALQSESSRPYTDGIAPININSKYLNQDMHTPTINTNLSNAYYYPYNIHLKYTNQYHPPYSYYPGNIYPFYNSNVNHHSRPMNNRNSNNRRSTKGGRYKYNHGNNHGNRASSPHNACNSGHFTQHSNMGQTNQPYRQTSSHQHQPGQYTTPKQQQQDSHDALITNAINNIIMAEMTSSSSSSRHYRQHYYQPLGPQGQKTRKSNHSSSSWHHKPTKNVPQHSTLNGSNGVPKHTQPTLPLNHHHSQNGSASVETKHDSVTFINHLTTGKGSITKHGSVSTSQDNTSVQSTMASLTNGSIRAKNKKRSKWDKKNKTKKALNKDQRGI